MCLNSLLSVMRLCVCSVLALLGVGRSECIHLIIYDVEGNIGTLWKVEKSLEVGPEGYGMFPLESNP